MRYFLIPLTFIVLLTACGVDTTGLSDQSSKQPKGSPTASVTVTEYGDFQCPACKSAHDTINQPLMQKYGDKIRFTFRQFPLDMHPYALVAAEASECAADQGKFWEFVDLDYKEQDQLNANVLYDWAKVLGLNENTFSRCVRSGIKEKAVKADYDEGIKKGVQGTPTYFVSGQRVMKNTLPDEEAAVDAALKQAEGVPL